MILAKEKRYKQSKEHDSLVCAQHVQGLREYQDGEVQGPGGRVAAAEAPSLCVVPRIGFLNERLGCWRFGCQCRLYTDL